MEWVTCKAAYRNASPWRCLTLYTTRPSPSVRKVITDVLALWPAARYWVLLVGPCASFHTIRIWNELRTPSQTTVYCQAQFYFHFSTCLARMGDHQALYKDSNLNPHKHNVRTPSGLFIYLLSYKVFRSLHSSGTKHKSINGKVCCGRGKIYHTRRSNLHTTSEHGVSSITTAVAHISAELTPPPI
jgi:hypothetical protein